MVPRRFEYHHDPHVQDLPIGLYLPLRVYTIYARGHVMCGQLADSNDSALVARMVLFRRCVLSTSTSALICMSDCCSLRSVRATLKGPVARKHFQAMSIARWGDGCRCRYLVKDTASPAQDDGEDDAVGDTKDNGAGSINGNGASDEKEGKGNGIDDNSGSREDADWLAFYLRRVRHRAVRSSPLDLLQVRSPTRP